MRDRVRDATEAYASRMVALRELADLARSELVDTLIDAEDWLRDKHGLLPTADADDDKEFLMGWPEEVVLPDLHPHADEFDELSAAAEEAEAARERET